MHPIQSQGCQLVFHQPILRKIMCTTHSMESCSRHRRLAGYRINVPAGNDLLDCQTLNCNIARCHLQLLDVDKGSVQPTLEIISTRMPLPGLFLPTDGFLCLQGSGMESGTRGSGCTRAKERNNTTSWSRGGSLAALRSGTGNSKKVGNMAP